MAQAPQHPSGEGGAEFVRRIVADPKSVPDVMQLTGYLGASSEEGHERLYLSADLSSSIDIPAKAILHRMAVPAEHDPHGAVTLWVQRDAKLIQKMSPAAQALAHYFAGAIQGAATAGGVAGAAGVGAAAAPPQIPQSIGACTIAIAACPPPTLACTNVCPTQAATPCPPCLTHVATCLPCASQIVVCSLACPTGLPCPTHVLTPCPPCPTQQVTPCAPCPTHQATPCAPCPTFLCTHITPCFPTGPIVCQHTQGVLCGPTHLVACTHQVSCLVVCTHATPCLQTELLQCAQTARLPCVASPAPACGGPQNSIACGSIACGGIGGQQGGVAEAAIMPSYGMCASVMPWCG